MGYGLRTLHSERKGYGGRADRKVAADKVRRIRDRLAVDEWIDECLDGSPGQWPWRCCEECGA